MRQLCLKLKEFFGLSGVSVLFVVILIVMTTPNITYAANTISASPDPATPTTAEIYTFTHDYGANNIAIVVYDSTSISLGYIENGSTVDSGTWDASSPVTCTFGSCLVTPATGTSTVLLIYREGSYTTECDAGSSYSPCATHSLASDTFLIQSGGGGSSSSTSATSTTEEVSTTTALGALGLFSFISGLGITIWIWTLFLG